MKFKIEMRLWVFAVLLIILFPLFIGAEFTNFGTYFLAFILWTMLFVYNEMFLTQEFMIEIKALKEAKIKIFKRHKK